MGSNPAVTAAVTDVEDGFGRCNKPNLPSTPPDTPQTCSVFQGDASLRELDVRLHPLVDGLEKRLVAVIGCGYVGSQLLSSFSNHYDVLGYDISEAQLQKAADHFTGNASRVTFTCDPRDLTQATHLLVSVPTLVKVDKTIDTSYVQAALQTISNYARQGSTIVFESSVAVGMTRSLLGPLARSRGFFAGMSPERVDPGRVVPPIESIPKILAGLDDIVPGSLDAISGLYSPVFETIHPVSCPEVAEMTKLYENSQRMMGIAFANEMADACIPHGIDPYEVCRAASTKPFGYMSFEPSLGAGGHCIPVNPWYLLSNGDFPLLKAATEKTEQRPAAIGDRILEALQGIEPKTLAMPPLVRTDSGVDFPAEDEDLQAGQGSSASWSPHLGDAGGKAPDWMENARPRVLVVGIGFKRGQSTLSNSAGLRLAQALVDSGLVEVSFADALVAQSAVPHIPRLAMSDWNRETLEKFDVLVVSFRQTGMDLGVLDDLSGHVKVEKWCQ